MPPVSLARAAARGRLLVGLQLLLSFLGATSARAGSWSARVRFVSATRAYLGAGRAQGLALGEAISIERNHVVIETCRIDQLGDHEAACPARKARAGDTFALGLASITSREPAPDQAEQPTAPELARAARAIDETPVEKVEYRGASAKLTRYGATLLSASVGHNAFVTFGRDGFQQERLELRLGGLPLRWAGFRLFAHLTGIISSVRPPTQRFRPEDVAQLYVWELAVSSREVGRPFAISVGRIWPHHTPGLALLDGAQLGWRRRDGLAEVGVYGGVVPDAITLYPTDERVALGVYYGHTLTPARGKALSILQTEGRLGLRFSATRPVQLELEWALLATLGRWLDLGAQARASLGAGDWARPRFESARVHAMLRAGRRVRVIGAVRYLDAATDYDALPSFFTQGRSYHANLDLAWDPIPWVSLALLSGLDAAERSVAGQLDQRAFVGAEVALPRLLRARGGASIGYREELGWYAGRTVYLSLNGVIGNRLRVLGRLGYLEDRPNGGLTELPFRELGAYLFAEGRILRWLSARLTASARIGLDPNAEGMPPAGGLVLRAELVGSL